MSIKQAKKLQIVHLLQKLVNDWWKQFTTINVCNNPLHIKQRHFYYVLQINRRIQPNFRPIFSPIWENFFFVYKMAINFPLSSHCGGRSWITLSNLNENKMRVTSLHLNENVGPLKWSKINLSALRKTLTTISWCTVLLRI